MPSTAAGYSVLEVLLRERVAKFRPSLISGGVEVPAARLLEAARAFAARLAADGIGHGDYVLLLMKNSPDYLAAALGVMFAGAVLVPVNARFTPAEIAELFELSSPKAWVADADLAAIIREAEGNQAPEQRYVIDPLLGRPLKQLLEMGRPKTDGPISPVKPDAIGAVFFTAGTTGRPKGAMTSHAAVAAFVDVVQTAMTMTPQDTVVLPMPMFYTGGLKASLANLLIGARVVIFPEWSPSDLVAAMRDYKATILWGVPSVWALMIRSKGFDPASVQTLRIVWRGGSFTPRSLLDDLMRIFPGLPHFHSYGLTECNMAAMETDAVHHEESCGFATYGTQISIEGDPKRAEVGEICVNGRQQFSGYLGDPERTAAAFTNGWIRTGDKGWLDADGRLRVLGRGSDVIIRGGENISAAEVERTIVQLPGVAEAAVVPVFDEVFGHELKALVVASGEHPLDPEQIRQECRRVLAEFKVPKYVEIRHEPLPKNASGKIMKASL